MGDEKVKDLEVERSFREIDGLTNLETRHVTDLRKRLADSEIESQERMNRLLAVQGVLLDKNIQLLDIQSVLLKEIEEGDGLLCESLRKIGRILGMVVAK